MKELTKAIRKNKRILEKNILNHRPQHSFSSYRILNKQFSKKVKFFLNKENNYNKLILICLRE